MLLVTSKTQAKYIVPPFVDDGGDILFRYHMPTGMFGSDLRISALEIRDFIVPHMIACIGQQVLPFHQQRAIKEFMLVLETLLTLPDNELDKIHNWIWVDRREDTKKRGYDTEGTPVEHAADNVVICISLRGGNPHAAHKPHGLVPGNITA